MEFACVDQNCSRVGREIEKKRAGMRSEDETYRLGSSFLSTAP